MSTNVETTTERTPKADTSRQATQTVPVRDAALALGISVDAVRARVRRGSLPAIKVEGEWQVEVPRNLPATVATDGDQVTPDQTDRDHAVASAVDLSPLVELISRQAKELADLREAATVWQLRARQAEDKVLALTAGPVATDPHPDTSSDAPGASLSHDVEPTRLVAWWRRLVGVLEDS